MKPSFAALRQHYPRNTLQEALFTDIGWTDLISKPAYRDTCAIRMSVALLASGMSLPKARMKATAGKLKGRYIEPGQDKLSLILKRTWGKPEVYKGKLSARDGIGKRSGVVSFFRIHGGGTADGGHIDLIWPGINGFQQCARSCYFSASEIWFWPLK
jgi:hypothetical protein